MSGIPGFKAGLIADSMTLRLLRFLRILLIGYTGSTRSHRQADE